MFLTAIQNINQYLFLAFYFFSLMVFSFTIVDIFKLDDISANIVSMILPVIHFFLIGLTFVASLTLKGANIKNDPIQKETNEIFKILNGLNCIISFSFWTLIIVVTVNTFINNGSLLTNYFTSNLENKNFFFFMMIIVLTNIVSNVVLLISHLCWHLGLVRDVFLSQL